MALVHAYSHTVAGGISLCAIGRAALTCALWPAYASRKSHVKIEILTILCSGGCSVCLSSLSFTTFDDVCSRVRVHSFHSEGNLSESLPPEKALVRDTLPEQGSDSRNVSFSATPGACVGSSALLSCGFPLSRLSIECCTICSQ